MGKKRQKQRTDFRKKYQGRVRKGDLTREFRTGDTDSLADVSQSERVSGKGDLTRKRTIQAKGNHEQQVNSGDLKTGRVVSVHGLKSRVLADDGEIYECAVRQVLKSLSIAQRSIVVAGDDEKIITVCGEHIRILCR